MIDRLSHTDFPARTITVLANLIAFISALHSTHDLFAAILGAILTGWLLMIPLGLIWLIGATVFLAAAIILEWLHAILATFCGSTH